MQQGSNLPIHQQMLYIDCVCCKELFAIAEVVSRANRSWRMVSSAHSEIKPHFQRDPRIIPVSPRTRVELEAAAAPMPASGQIICPRCGADNRNWVPLKQNKIPIDFRDQSSFLLYVFGVILVGASVGLLGWMIDDQLPNNGFGRNATLLIAIILALTLPPWSIWSKWQQIREQNHLRRLVPTNPIFALVSLPWLLGAFHFALLTLIIPFLLFILMPAMINLANPAPKVAPGLTDRARSLIAELDQLIQEARRSDETDNDLELLEHSKLNLQNYVQRTTRSRLTPNEAAPTAVSDRQFLMTWFKGVGTVSGVMILLSAAAVTGYVHRIDTTLPRPIFYSISAMSKIAVLEACAALELGEMDILQVSWIEIKRNKFGGLELVGRCPLVGGPVQFRYYLISTDPWVRIRSVEIRDTRYLSDTAV